ncbi:ligand-binding sensor domain-containing protein [Marinilabilia rubra]|uniref:histidine kinase n=1 Tax=Marinilabilia rubra TaxID=2162893 RepID=A0A2U2BAU6_9BACT|nr:sensor histidine kinase [Marinilabilia rubra]PWE00192.1 hypothetical protein DDZ16_07515 [Marinilabilia rubra]
MKRRICNIISILLIACSASVFSQHSDVRFRRLTINDGLSLSSVYTIYQDRLGYMWFGTEDGLNRYDGNNFRIFRPEVDEQNSIAHKWIEFIEEDNKGRLWFGSRGGLSLFDPHKESFLTYHSSNQEGQHLTNDTITSMLVDSQEAVWAGTMRGLVKINPVSLVSQSVYVKRGDQLASRVYALFEDYRSNIWIGTDRGLYVYTPKASSKLNEHGPVISLVKELAVYSIVGNKKKIWVGSDIGLFELSGYANSNQPNRWRKIEFNFSFNQVEDLYHSSINSSIWVSTDTGLFRFNTHLNELSSVVRTVDVTHSLSIHQSKPFIQGKNGNIWYGTHGDGVYQLDAGGRLIRHLKNDPVNRFSLSENSVNCIYEDNSGLIWVGTFGAGISIYDPRANKFSLYRHRPGDDKSISSNFIWTIFETQGGEIWLGSDNKGITRYIPSGEEYIFYDHQAGKPNSLAVSSVRDIFEDSQGRIWIGTDGGGLNLFLPEKQGFVHYQNKNGDAQSISDNSVREIFEDRYGVLWVGTRNGLNRFDPEKEIFQRYLHSPDDPATLSHNFIYASIIQDSDDNLWIGTYGGGLNVMNYQTGLFKSYRSDPENSRSLSDDIVFDIYEDPKTGLFWIGTNNGLNRFDPHKQLFTRFGLAEGLPNEVIYSVVPDQTGNLWLSTNAGICCFNPYSHSAVSYDVTDGLQSNEFNGGAFHRGKSGKLYFGGVYGLNVIDPEQLPKIVIPKKVLLTGMEILGKEVRVADNYQEQRAGNDSKENDYFLVNKSVSYLDTLILSYQYRFFSFEFVVPGNINAQRMYYSYRMENLDDKWHDSGNRNYVTYANMKPGNYSFQARASLDKNTWSMPSKPLTLIIEPPFWQRWWFYLLEFILIISIAFFIYRYLLKAKTNKLLRTRNVQITEANAKLAQSEKELRELNATKDKFFSIIAHDLKNPFASLMSITEVMHNHYSMLDEDEKEQGIEKIDDSVKGIFHLLENLLTWSRAQSNRIKFEPVIFDLTLMIHEVVLIYKPLAKVKGIDLTETSENELIKVFADREMVHTILRNLVNNAIKYCSQGDAICIHSAAQKDWVCVKVKDTGVGISEENLSKLFKIDAKIKSTGTAGEKGTGLGLILCREFVEINGGKFFVESELGQGTACTFKLKRSEKRTSP